MAISEDQLVRWTRPASDSEETKCNRAVSMIERALKGCPKLVQRRWTILPQGSYQNNTNARTNSDVDVAVVFDDAMYPDYTYSGGETAASLGHVDVNLPLADARALVLTALQQMFGRDQVVDGNKAIQVKSNTARVDADVVVAYEFRGYLARVDNQPQFVTGLKFYAKDGRPVINFPVQHQDNGRAKNRATQNRYKYATRIIKHARYDMLERSLPAADGVSSFLLECAMHNISNEVFSSSTSWSGRMQNLLHSMYQSLQSGEAENVWTEVSGCKWLFQPSYGIQANWTPSQLQSFVLAAYNHIVR